MAKNVKSAPRIKVAAKKSTITTPVRNSAIPKVKAVISRKPIEITGDMIAARAFEIFASGQGGSEQDNWFAAERQLRNAA